MIASYRHDTALENLNNLLSLDVDHVETLAHDFHQTLHFPRNIISFVLKAEDGGTDFYEEIDTGKRLVFAPGNVLFLPVNAGIRFNRSLKALSITIHFSLEFAFCMDIFSGTSPCIQCYAPEMVDMMKACLAEPDKLKASCGMRQTILDFCYRNWPDGIMSKLASAKDYGEVFEYAKKHCDATLTVAQLAEIKKLRIETFSRSFKKVFGDSPHAFIRKSLIKKISSLLLTDRTVKETAQELKFSSEFYLSRFFAKHVGLPPKQFQKNYHAIRLKAER